MVVGITGGIGSGKTTVVKLFKKFNNVVVYYADDEAKKLMNTSLVIKEKLIKEFSNEVFIAGKLNRPFLASIVFNDKKKLKILNAIVHPEVNKHLSDFIKLNKDKDYIVYENAILFENGSDYLCDKIITVTAMHESKVSRVILRDKTTKEAVEKRMNNQWGDTIKILQSHYVVYNEKLNECELQVLRIHNKLTKN